MHVFNIAEELTKLGHDCIVIVPKNPDSVLEHGPPHFLAIDFDGARTNGLTFQNGSGPDIIHAWTPRECVHRTVAYLVGKYGCIYLVHMEDNEEYLVASELKSLSYDTLAALPSALVETCIEQGSMRIHPHRYREFIQGASAYTCLVDRLLEFKPDGIPGLVFWPGYEAEFADAGRLRAPTRAQFDIDEATTILVYSGNSFAAMAPDLRRLYIAVGTLWRRGYPIK